MNAEAIPHNAAVRWIAGPAGFSLAQTCAPVAWAKGRWPNVDWIDDALVWVGWENGDVVVRSVRQSPHAPSTLAIAGTAAAAGDRTWADSVLGLASPPPLFTDTTVDTLRARYAGLRAFSAGSLFDGLVSSIVGQSISVAAAAVAEARLAALFHDGIELRGRTFRPLPRADQLAAADPALIRQSGVTWRRAEAIVAAAAAMLAGRLPDPHAAGSDPEGARVALRALPLVGPWTAESALLWGIGLADAYPSGDAALLRAARHAYGQPELAHPALDRLAAGWCPARGWAARFLWTELLGVAAESRARVASTGAPHATP